MNAGDLLPRLWRFTLVWLLAFSFGGFLFYASVVVPNGNEILGSTTQGFVTQQVTRGLNIAVVITTIALACECWLGWKGRRKTANTTLIGCNLTIGLTCGLLMWLHVQMDAMLTPESMNVDQPSRFYSVHRIYLWVSTLQWSASIPVVWIVLNSARTSPQAGPTKIPG